MLPIAEFEKRFNIILALLDAIADELGDEDLEDLNAEFEDTLLMLSEIDPKAKDAREEIDDALDELEALKDSYARWPEAREAADRLGMLIQMARGNA